MGRWGSGIWDSDGALDAVAEIERGIVGDLRRYARTRPGPRTPARVAAAVGILLQLGSIEVTDPERARPVVRAIRKHAANLKAKLGPDASRLLERVAAGEGKALANRKGGRSGSVRKALGGYRDGVREPSLFAHAEARAYVQKVARRCSGAVRRLTTEAGGFDLYEDEFLGPMGLLIVLSPWSLPRKKIRRWRKGVERQARQLRADGADNPDRPFLEGQLLPNIRLTLSILAARAAASEEE
jgi:hypothetical protein